MAGVLTTTCKNAILSACLRGIAMGSPFPWMDALKLNFTSGFKELRPMSSYFASPVGGVMAVTGTPTFSESTPTGSLVSVTGNGATGAGSVETVSDLQAALDTSAEVQLSNLAAAGATTLLKFAIKLAKVSGTLQFSEALRSYFLQMLIALGSTNSIVHVRVYSGTPPADVEDPPTGTLLWQFNNASFNTPVGGEALLATSNTAALAAGAPGYARMEVTNNPLLRVQGTCGMGSNYDFSMTVASWAQAEQVAMNGFIFRIA